MTGRSPVLGCIADDFTGAVDVAAGVSLTGLNTVIAAADSHGDVQELAELGRSADVVVVALKSRTNPAGQAVEQSLHAADLLLDIGATTLFFKYCSTFDSTPHGNIGPVADALVDLLDAPLAVVVPGYPANHRTVRGGMLYVGDTLLSDSPMRHHPLTPMTSSDVSALLTAQSRYPVGRLPLQTVRTGAETITSTLERLQAAGARYAVIDTITDEDIQGVAMAVRSHRLVTGGAALAHALAGLTASDGGVVPTERTADQLASGRQIVLSGSCSAASQLQVAHFGGAGDVLQLDPRLLDDPVRHADHALDWAQDLGASRPALISTTVDSAELVEIQRELGRDVAAARVEAFFAAVGAQLVQRGFNQIIVGGGETSAVVTAALGVREMVVSVPISPGLAWCVSHTPQLALALKSGNFGPRNVFTRAFELLSPQTSTNHNHVSNGG